MNSDSIEKVRELHNAQLNYLEEVVKVAIANKVITWREGTGMVISNQPKLLRIFVDVYAELSDEKKPTGWDDPNDWYDDWRAVLKVAEHFKEQWLPLVEGA
jgi:hypothetical protein